MTFLADMPAINIAPAISLWLLAMLIVACLSIYLYIEQRRIAPLGSVLLLAFLRLCLIVLLAILFLQPAFKWTQTRTSAGTLWFVMDQSPSMQTADPQALPGERLHWAEGLGMLPEKLRVNRPDYLVSQIHALAGEFAAIEPPTEMRGGGADEERGAIVDYANHVKMWAEGLDKVLRNAESSRGPLNRLSGNAGNAMVEMLGRAYSLADMSLGQIRASATARDAVAAIDRYTITRALDDAEKIVRAASGAADAVFMRERTSDGAVTTSTARVSQMTRQDLAYGMLADPDARATKLLADLAKKYHLRIASFSDKTQAAGVGGGVDAESIPGTLKDALSPAGNATNLENALQFVSEQIATDEAASVIIVSDGRNNVPGNPTGPAKNLAARGVHIYGLLVGSHEVSPDAAVEQIDAPDWVYKGDTIRGRTIVRLDGLQGKTAIFELRRGDVVIDRHSIFAKSNHQAEPVDFSDKPPESSGAVEYQVRISEMPGEVNTQNNVATFRISLKKDHLYALYIEDRPRWEFRYLAATLSRDLRMKVQTVLLSPAIIAGVAPPAPVRASPDNPHDEAQLLPVTAEEWKAFDLIILGDISPDVLGIQAQQYIAEAVRDRGSTLITVAGQRFMPQKFAGSPLAELLPVTTEAQWSNDWIARHSKMGFHPGIAPTAGSSVLAQLDLDAGGNASAWSSIPMWFWHSPYTQARPAASVIWTINEIMPGVAGIAQDPIGSVTAASKHALLATMSIGSGRSLYLASDQTWRLRQVNGTNMHERFWGQVLRWAVGSDLPAGGKYVRFGANQPVYAQDQPAVITARVLRDDLTPYTGLSFSAVARAVQSKNAAATHETARPQGSVEAQFKPMEGGGSPGYYTATLGGLPVGDVEISLKGAEVERLLDTDPSVTQRTLLIKVEPSMNAERRNMNTDPVLLDTVAHAGNGYSLDAQYADLLLSRLPKIEHTETIMAQIGFFTDPHALGTRIAHGSFLALFAFLITAEWLVRKRAGLV